MLGLEGGTGKRAISRWNLARCLPYEDLQNAKKLGLDHYETRSYHGWYRHITLVLVAAAVLLELCVRHPDPDPTAPLIALTRSEVQHLLAHLLFPPPSTVSFLWLWSRWRRSHQYWASDAHRRRRATTG